MQLWLMRHADAASGASFAEDALRPLTDKGRRIQLGVGRAMAHMGLVPDRVFASPRIRAQQTAELTVEGLGQGDVENLDTLDGGYPVDMFLDSLPQVEGDVRVLCVGHEPDMSTWSSQLLSDCNSNFLVFKKSAMIGLEFTQVMARDAARLLFYYRAKDLLACSDGSA